MFNAYQKQYKQLKTQYDELDGNAKSIVDLYAFRDLLLQDDSLEAKRTLVEVYRLLGYMLDAYELFLEVANKQDIKAMKRLKTMEIDAKTNGNKYAISNPKATSTTHLLAKEIPVFRYHPNPIATGAFKVSEVAVTCDCCNKATQVYYTQCH